MSTFSRDEARKTNVLAAREASLNFAGSCGVHERAGLEVAQRLLPHEGTILKLITIQSVNGLG